MLGRHMYPLHKAADMGHARPQGLTGGYIEVYGQSASRLGLKWSIQQVSYLDWRCWDIGWRCGLCCYTSWLEAHGDLYSFIWDSGFAHFAARLVRMLLREGAIPLPGLVSFVYFVLVELLNFQCFCQSSSSVLVLGWLSVCIYIYVYIYSIYTHHESWLFLAGVVFCLSNSLVPRENNTRYFNIFQTSTCGVHILSGPGSWR